MTPGPGRPHKYPYKGYVMVRGFPFRLRQGYGVRKPVGVFKALFFLGDGYGSLR